MERMVAEILRKMVRKYSGKRPDVIAVATENATAGFPEHLDAKSSGNFGPSSAASHLSRSPAMSLEGSYKTHPDNPEVDAEGTPNKLRLMNYSNSVVSLNKVLHSMS
jgi:hypothetical protein